jgi:hypothetical protein
LSGSTAEEASLPTGTYRVYAFNTLDGLEYASPEALREYPGEAIRSEQARQATVTLDLIQRR